MSAEAKFNKAVEIIQSLPKDGPVQPTNDDRLVFYKYFKQATVGDVNTSRPGLLDFTGKAKWDAWDSVKGTTKEDAHVKYVEYFKTFVEKSGAAEAADLINQVESAS
ncbi:acyl-CoA-binding protein [Cantharellus anzutake]|uniref:acyl-CoA-binding protein n=1 Tax=Cantharellus anzutake TaxID=1750568 RepID=UPI001906914B|nr:acyl-CoA-binding protein [Cantharellus anzutake]KAF8340382.1 acyl-CoA-binding protein [Cantharellus anzutake]